MRLIHCADIHLDSKLSANLDANKRKIRRQELLKSFENMIGYAVNNDIKVILIAGDLFDTDSVTKTVSNAVYSAVESNPDIEFYYLKGNHDNNSFLASLDCIPDNLHMFGETLTTYMLADRIALSGIELSGDNAFEIYDAMTLDTRNFNILTLHGQIYETASKDKAENINLSLLKNKSIDYLALGHVHRYVKEELDARGSYCYPGCLEGRGFDECGKHGFIVLEIDEDTHECKSNFVEWGRRLIHEVYVDVSDCMDSVSALTKTKLELDNNEVDENDMVKVILSGSIDAEAEINASYIYNAIYEDYFFIKINDETKVKVDYARYSLDVSLKGEFIRSVMADDSLTEEVKGEIIRTGLLALAGEEF